MIADAVPALLHGREQRGDLGLAQEVFAALVGASVVRALLTFRPLGVAGERIGIPRDSEILRPPRLTKGGFCQTFMRTLSEAQGPVSTR